MPKNRLVNLQLKVGLMAASGLLFFAVTIFTVGKFHFKERGYPLELVFQFVDAIKPEADVVVGGGVKIGRVDSIAVQDQRVHLHLRIRPSFKIPRTARFQILSNGLMGDKYVNVIIHEQGGAVFEPGDVIQGLEPSTMDRAFQSFGKVADSITSVLSDPQLKISVMETMANLQATSRRLDNLTRSNEQPVNQAIRDFSKMAQSLEHFSEGVDMLSQRLNRVLSDSNQAQLEGTLKNLNDVTGRLNAQLARVEKGQGPLGTLINDEKMAADLRDLIADLKKNPWRLFWKQ